MTALAASIGTGNIAGVATAIVSGGPGALFWIWVYGFVATSIKFAEAVLGLTFRETRGDTVLSGPMYYLRDGLRSPALAWTFAFVAAVAALTTTPFTQPNSMALVLELGVWRSPRRLRRRDRGADVAGHHRRHQVDRQGGGEALAAEGRPLPRRRHHRHPGQRGADPRNPRADRARSVHDPVGARVRHLRRDALRHRPRHLRERSGLRHRRRRLRHGPQQPADAAGAERGDGDVHRLVRHLDDQRHDDPADRRLAVGADEHGGGRRRVQHGDAGRLAGGSSRSAPSSSATRP